MSLSSLYLWAKKIHRWSLLVIILLTLIMAGTGTLMKYPGLGELVNADFGLVRYVHREMSGWFSLAMAIMILTGLGMYFIPEIIKSQQKQNLPPTV